VSALCESYFQEFGLGSGSPQGGSASPQVQVPPQYCQDQGLNPKYLSVSGNNYMNVGLATYQATGYFCYELIVTPSSNNLFDSDDYWALSLRTWICGKFYATWDDYGWGPDAWVDSDVLVYGNCGPQADSGVNQSFVDIDGHTQYVPYVNIG
jgi:hypothetical protein